MKICKKICNQCPFSKDSAPGWLGPHTVEEILNSQQFEIPFSCHKKRKDDSTITDILNKKLQICRGWVASASKSFKLFGQHPQFGFVLKKLQDEITQEDKEAVLTRNEFQEYHDA